MTNRQPFDLDLSLSRSDGKDPSPFISSIGRGCYKTPLFTSLEGIGKMEELNHTAIVFN